MPEWSIGAVSKTVDQLAGPRVRIPVSPQRGLIISTKQNVRHDYATKSKPDTAIVPGFFTLKSQYMLL